MPDQIYIESMALVSPLGKTIQAHLAAFQQGKSGIKLVEKSGFNQTTLPVSKCVDIHSNRYDELLNQALDNLLYPLDLSKKTALIVSSTKGNMDLLPNDTFASTRTILNNRFPSVPLIIISNACISGVMAINTAADYLKADLYDQVLVIGIDTVSDFVCYGFQSLFALSDAACKPFDSKRNGTSLGEACGIVLVSKTKKGEFAAIYKGGSSSNDANHISGPSRTGEGLVRSIERTLKRSGVGVSEIDFVSAHGTATVYNDEMESIAFGRVGLDQTPINSMKGYFGHTLGAAGVIETIMSLVSMQENSLFPSLGFEENGTSVTLNIIPTLQTKAIQTVLKTASGFGGGNASLIVQKEA